jgi:hypothetical protein
MLNFTRESAIAHTESTSLCRAKTATSGTFTATANPRLPAVEEQTLLVSAPLDAAHQRIVQLELAHARSDQEPASADAAGGRDASAEG